MNKAGGRGVAQVDGKMVGGERRAEVAKWRRGTIREMDEVRRRESDERGFYGSDSGEARDEIACGWDGKRGQKGSNAVMVKKVIDEAKSEEGRENRVQGNG